MDDLVARLGDLIQERARHHDRLTVAIDGPDAAGKTTLADALAHHLRGHVVRTSLDSFLRPEPERYRRGDLSPEGCYRDSYDYEKFRHQVLAPFAGAGAKAILVADGLFLLRPELRDAWHLTVFLDVSPRETLRRARARDTDRFGDDLDRRYVERYLPAQQLYRAEADPLSFGDVIVGYDDPSNPDVRRWPVTAPD